MYDRDRVPPQLRGRSACERVLLLVKYQQTRKGYSAAAAVVDATLAHNVFDDISEIAPHSL